MRLLTLPTGQAAGSLLAHGTRIGGRLLAKGRVLRGDDLALLQQAGIQTLTVAQLDPGDVAEDQAAAELAAALCDADIYAQPAETGRANLFARRAGVFAADRAGVDAINGVDEAITLATLADGARVAAGDMLATIKIIPFAVPQDLLAQAIAQAAHKPLALARFRPRRAGLILTTLPGLKDSILASTEEVMRTRIESRGGSLACVLRMPHRRDSILAGLRALHARACDLFLIAGASAVVDREDAAPAAITAMGGEILHLGMPVDPGNLLCLGRIGSTPAIVLPGCARSPADNGIDLVLDRLFADQPVGRAEIMGMGVGGLLKDISRPLPRAAASQGDGGEVAALVLAAGLSRRFGPANKLLQPFGADGAPIILHCVRAACASQARPVIVVLGHDAAAVRAALPGQDVQFVTAADYAQGLAASLRAGISALPASAGAALVLLGDMPLITPALLNSLISAHDPAAAQGIVVPLAGGKRGNPVLWDRRYFAALAALSGDRGGRGLLGQFADDVLELELGDAALLTDIDTPDALG